MEYTLVSFVNNSGEFLCNGFLEENLSINYTQNIYTGGLIKPKFVDGEWTESHDLFSTIDTDLSKPFLQILCEKYNIPFNLISEVQYDNLNFLKPKEAVYGLKGDKLFKNYVYEENGEEKLVVSQFYSNSFKDIEYNGVIYKDILTGLNKSIIFHNFEGENVLQKDMQTLEFNIIPIETINPSTGESIILFSSSKLEEYLQDKRYKADALMKSFNPNLYNWLYKAYGEIYFSYLKTGDSSVLINAFETETSEFNLNILNKTVEDIFLKVILGELEQYPIITVKELIIMNLQ